VIEKDDTVALLGWWPSDDSAEWLNPLDTYLAGKLLSLADSVPPAVLEVGVWKRAWITTLERNFGGASNFVSIDPYIDFDAIRDKMWASVAHNGYKDRFSLYSDWSSMVHGESSKSARLQFDLIHIDGLHTYCAVRNDLLHA